VRVPFLESTPEMYETAFKSGVYGGVLFSQAILPLLLKNVGNGPYSPTLIFTGATASYKANAQMAVFSTGKFALRSLAQSLSREFAPKGVHVSHVNIDGVVDAPKSKTFVINGNVEDGKLKPEDVAEAYWNLHTQPRSAWAWEFDLRPWVEKW